MKVQYKHEPVLNIRKRTIAVPKTGHYIYCGSGTYDLAVVAQSRPFILISESGDMMWENQKPENFNFYDQADWKVWRKVKRRMKQEGIK